MLRRIGYGLGLLFVLACVAAYPLTWRRWVVVSYAGAEWSGNVGAAEGMLSTTVGVNDRFKDHYQQGFGADTNPTLGRLFENRGGGYRYFADSDCHNLYCPLWMPALAVSLFMAWRWRRGRTRRRAVGFPVADRSA